MGSVDGEIWPFIDLGLSFFRCSCVCGDPDIGNSGGTTSRSTCHLFRSRIPDLAAVLLNLDSRSTFVRVTRAGDKRDFAEVTGEVTRSHERKGPR